MANFTLVEIVNFTDLLHNILLEVNRSNDVHIEMNGYSGKDEMIRTFAVLNTKAYLETVARHKASGVVVEYFLASSCHSLKRSNGLSDFNSIRARSDKPDRSVVLPCRETFFEVNCVPFIFSVVCKKCIT